MRRNSCYQFKYHTSQEVRSQNYLVSNYQIFQASQHARHWGAGRSSATLLFWLLKYDQQDIDLVLNFMLQHDYCYTLCRLCHMGRGENSVVNSVGEVIRSLNFFREFMMRQSCGLYLKLQTGRRDSLESKGIKKVKVLEHF